MASILDEISGDEAIALVSKLIQTQAVSPQMVRSLLDLVRADTRSKVASTLTMPLLDRTAIVTGASRGIGKETALKLGLLGANVAVTYKTAKTEADALVEELVAMGRRGVSIQFDIAEISGVDRLFAETKSILGSQLDIFVANAASSVFKSTATLVPHHFTRTYASNVTNFAVTCQKAAETMKATGGGKIVALSSFTTDRVLDNMALLASAKAAVATLVRYMAVEWASAGITVNTVVPGIVSTDSTLYYNNHGAPDGYLERAVQATPLGRLVTAAEVAAVIAFVCTDDARAITGQQIVVDGGLTLSQF